jgi:hypothetical protein
MGIKPLPLGRLFLFALLSGADLFLTWRLVQQGDGLVYESNPLANWWLRHYGWLGLVAYKGLAVGLVLGLWAVVVRYRPNTGGWMLTFACSAVAVVVLYSSLLAGYFKIQPDEPESEALRQAKRQNYSLNDQLNQYHHYYLLSWRLGDEVIAQRCTLSEAVHELTSTEKGQDASWFDKLRRRYLGRSDEECLAAHFLENVAASLSTKPALAERVLQRLEADFAATYGKLSPCRYDPWLMIRLARTPG